MALPHLPRSAQSDLQIQNDERRRLAAAAAAHDRLVAPETYARSLEAFIALRSAARKAEALVQRRAQLCSLLREERRQQIDALQAMEPPPPENLWARFRPPGFFEGLYSDTAAAAKEATVPPHLRSDYQAELWGQAVPEQHEDRGALLAALRDQIESRRSREADEVRQEREEGRKLLLRLEEMRREEEAREEEEKWRRMVDARKTQEECRQRSAEAATAKAAADVETFRELERLEERLEETRSKEKERSARLDREAREAQARARYERARAREKARSERAAEGVLMQEEEMRRAAEDAVEDAQRRRAMEERRAGWRMQEEEKNARKEMEKRREAEEAEDDRKAEEAYGTLLQLEKERMKKKATKPPWATDD